MAERPGAKPPRRPRASSRATSTGYRARAAAWLRSHPRAVRTTLASVTFVAALGFGLVYGAWALVCRDGRCPAVEILETYQPRQTSKLFAADGRFIAELGLERRTLVKIADIPPVVRDAFVITEDKRFYRHAGIDWMRIPGAVFHNVMSGGYAQGFSTITMQLARNIFPDQISREKNLLRKLKEAKVARAIEDRYSKDKILELYLNQINLGSGAYGVETASQRYFGKRVHDLNVAEAATLAALPKAPGRYNPRRFPERAIQRRNTIIELMRRNGAVDDADASLAKAYPLQLARRAESGEVAPYFVEWVRQQLDDRFGSKLYEQGLKVYTTLDLDMQSAAERAMETQLRAIEGGKYGRFPHGTYEQYIARTANKEEEASSAPNSPYLQGAFIAVDPRNGGVRALVGGRDFDDSKFNRAVQAMRQPGSTFKPIVYSAAIANGRSPATIVDDAPISVSQGENAAAWTPQNFDGKFEGPIPLRRGFYQSRNMVAIRVGMELGERTVIDMARRFGITTPIPPYPSINIGAADVYPLEIISGYSTFSNLGVRSAPTAITRVENQHGDVLWEPQPQRTQVLSPAEAWIMVDMMKDIVVRGTAANVWASGFHVPSGGKTGTTNDGTDAWFIGYTADLVAGVWMGFDRPQKIKANAQGGILAAPAYATFMNEVYRRKPAAPDWPRPDGVVTRQIDALTGELFGPRCMGDPSATEYFVEGTEPMRECEFMANMAPLASGDSTAHPTAPIPGAAKGKTAKDTLNPFKIPDR